MANMPKWDECDLDMIKEACRHGEAQLAAQVQLATSADQRASVLAGIYVAASTGVIGAMATGDAFKHSHPLTIGAGVAAGCFLVAAILCIKATLPSDFWTPGNLPSEWYADLSNKVAIKNAIGEQAAHFDQHILDNNQVMVSNSRYFLAGAVLGIIAPLLGFVAAGTTCLTA